MGPGPHRYSGTNSILPAGTADPAKDGSKARTCVLTFFQPFPASACGSASLKLEEPRPEGGQLRPTCHCYHHPPPP